MGVMYDMNVLAGSSEFDAVTAKKNFKSTEGFFEFLNEVVGKSGDYLRSYNPTMLIYSNEIQQHFLDDLSHLEQTFRLLEVTSILDEFKSMREAINDKKIPELSDGIIKFNARLKIVLEDIELAHLPDIPTKPEPPVVKPLLLCVDERTTVLASVTGVLQRDFKVVSVTSGKRALDMIKRYTPVIFLIGVEMHGMSGYEFAKQIRQNNNFKNTPIMFMTDVAAAVGDMHILVPIDRKQLLKQVNAVFQ